MFRVVLTLMVSLTLALLAACSDLGSNGCREGEVLDDGSCKVDPSSGGTNGGRFDDPDPKTRPMTLGCTNNRTLEVSVLTWDLTVDPGPIVGGEAFGALFHGLAVFDETLLDAGQGVVPGGYKRSALLELKATVLVRAGVTSEPREVVLTPEPTQQTCTYNESGSIGPEAGPFRTCAKANDNPDGSNDDCTGLGGVPDPENPCGDFNVLTTSSDCDPGGECDTLDDGSGVKNGQCAANGFCVTGPLEVVLEGAVEGFLADGAGNVLFGWEDENTGAVIDDSGGPNDGAFILPPAVFDAPPGPNGFRTLLLGDDPVSVEVAFECTMGVGTTRLTPTPPSDLISFVIQTR